MKLKQLQHYRNNNFEICVRFLILSLDPGWQAQKWPRNGCCQPSRAMAHHPVVVRLILTAQSALERSTIKPSPTPAFTLSVSSVYSSGQKSKQLVHCARQRSSLSYTMWCRTMSTINIIWNRLTMVRLGRIDVGGGSGTLQQWPRSTGVSWLGVVIVLYADATKVHTRFTYKLLLRSVVVSSIEPTCGPGTWDLIPILCTAISPLISSAGILP